MGSISACKRSARSGGLKYVLMSCFGPLDHLKATVAFLEHVHIPVEASHLGTSLCSTVKHVQCF